MLCRRMTTKWTQVEPTSAKNWFDALKVLEFLKFGRRKIRRLSWEVKNQLEPKKYNL